MAALAGTATGVYLSTNNGSNWNAVNTGFPINIVVGQLAISGTNIFAGTYNYGDYVTYANNVYFCLRTTTLAPTNTSHWTVIIAVDYNLKADTYFLIKNSYYIFIPFLFFHFIFPPFMTLIH